RIIYCLSVLVYNNFLDLHKNILDNYKMGIGKGITWIISIDKDNIDLVKKFLELGMQIKHIKNMPILNFAIGDREVSATIEEMEGGKMVQSLLTSNEPMYVQHFKSVFEELWKTGADPDQRITDIKQGLDTEVIQTIEKPAMVQELFFNILRSAKSDIMIILPTVNAFFRQEKLGSLQLAQRAARERNVRVRMLMPRNGYNHQTSEKEMSDQLKKQYLDIRYVESTRTPTTSAAKVTLLLADRKSSLAIELKDDLKDSFTEAVGRSNYSNNKIVVLSYIAIFENLWNQSELYEQIRQAYEQLKIHDTMHEEFINMAAHELRNPIQPILGLTQALRTTKREVPDRRQEDMLDAIIRNAKRLQRLTDDILDVARIENRALQINRERFELSEVIINVISDCKNQLKNEPSDKQKNISIVLLPSYENIYIEVDKNRLTQVMHNLLINAINYTKEGIISVCMEVNRRDIRNLSKEVIVSVKDSGNGIDPSIFPRLFSKFATNSPKGTGLALFISKSIIEAHGGRIWAKNNSDVNREALGATFYFSLPLVT
ncbi:MAG TPA: HAMP domain-containing sensor histidine kinase, partial [Candidatus Bathyarchaeia archaeon]|nr:HAMP domain-containing sensor histidine kinase [Candidatus Bathyarchaeia archaeon]